ncbi:5458_t:CDS:10 [Gigaspora margarita]|uniref:5458_t:CDS:1 n=1 Tax=Gigaspora margarita TaxID=4874 RepID=A0ABN7W462_GIGMA|nr:5458_t:CDS:10 [Gigaspora margarita]
MPVVEVPTEFTNDEEKVFRDNLQNQQEEYMQTENNGWQQPEKKQQNFPSPTLPSPNDNSNNPFLEEKIKYHEKNLPELPLEIEKKECQKKIDDLKKQLEKAKKGKENNQNNPQTVAEITKLKSEIEALKKDKDMDSSEKQLGLRKKLEKAKANNAVVGGGILAIVGLTATFFIVKGLEPLKALIFDLLYSRYYGVIIYVRIFDGELTKGQKIKFRTNPQKVYQVERVGVKTPKEVKVGDTALDLNNNSSPLEGYQEVKPNVYSNLYPSDSSEYKEFKKSLEELQVQDSSLSLETIDSQLLGSGFRCGFLGLLHREIICERLEKEFNCEIITTPPSITYRVIFSNGEIVETNNPQRIPTKDKIKNIEELFISLNIATSEEHLGAISQLCQNKRVHRSSAYERAKVACEQLKMTLSQQTFTVPIQATIGNQVIARETLPALKKHVTGNMYVSAKSQPSSFENNQPPSDNSEIQQLKLQLNVVKNQLNNLTNDPQKSQLEDKITTLENKVKDLTNTDKSTIQQLEQEIKEIKEELKNNDKPNDNPHPTDKKEAKLRYAGKGAINEAVFSNVFLEDTFKQGLKVFYVD